MTIIEVKNIVKSFGAGNTLVSALNNISFNIAKGEYVTFMGPSGAGKSTLINILAGLGIVDTGKVLIDDKNLSKMSDNEKCDLRRHQVGIVFQFFNLHPGLTVAENIQLPLVIASVKKKKHEEMIDHAIDLVGIKKQRNYYPFELSGGEQQRTAIARALVMKPDILLADEPTGDLDSEHGLKIIELLHELNKKENLTVIQVTHDESMLMINDRLIQMQDGKIIKDIIVKTEEDLPKYDFFNNGESG